MYRYGHIFFSERERERKHNGFPDRRVKMKVNRGAYGVELKNRGYDFYFFSVVYQLFLSFFATNIYYA